MANNAEEHERKILNCTQAIAFLGTPHRGSDLADWATIAGNMVNIVKRANTRIVDTLKPDSEVLEIITHEFHKMLKALEREKKDISITCYAEEKPVVKWGKSFMVCNREYCRYVFANCFL